MAEYIVIGLIVAAAFAYVAVSMIKKYKRLSKPADSGGCVGNCGHCCDCCPFSKEALERKMRDGKAKKKKGGCGCGCCGG